MERWLVTILGQAIKMASPSVLENIRQTVQEAVDHAATTENPWDDILLWIIQMIVGKPGETKETVE